MFLFKIIEITFNYFEVNTFQFKPIYFPSGDQIRMVQSIEPEIITFDASIYSMAVIF